MVETRKAPAGRSAEMAASAVDGIEALLRAALAGDVSLGATLKFVHPGADVLVIDGRKTPNEVHRRDIPADCTVHIDPLLNLDILQGHVDQNVAFRQGRIRIVGDLSAVTRLRPIVARQAGAVKE
ncbi:SCP2 sterol-binding domain-containing protein [uncultured Parvibaculum sp.]|uniref:SCP2 sterol-binding domain-containing protein n=1 Tax=uncultured Parvibaculum sp. TaxID=291828 RepID=UPI0030DCC5D9|tara:strand:- start:1903 stop:2277 length:375 start_codon:yes stop_codon:yes gene_type:complete